VSITVTQSLLLTRLRLMQFCFVMFFVPGAVGSCVLIWLHLGLV